MSPDNWWTVISRIGEVVLFVFVVAASISVIRLSAHVRSRDNEQVERPYRPRRRPSGL